MLNVFNNFCRKGLAKIQPTKTQEAEMQRVAALLSAPVVKNKVSNYVLNDI